VLDRTGRFPAAIWKIEFHSFLHAAQPLPSSASPQGPPLLLDDYFPQLVDPETGQAIVVTVV
jgi:hypothetical protein